MRKLLIIPLLFASLLTGGCGEPRLPFVHRIDIPQGNVVTQDMLDKLEPGLNKRQVRYIMGSPMLVDVFNQEEWIYLYSFEPGGGERVQRRVSLFFTDDRLAKVTGNVKRTDDMAVAVKSAQGTSRSVDVPEGVGAGYEDGGILQGVIDRFTGLNPWSKDGKRPQPAADDTAAPEGAQPAAPSSPSDTMRRFSLDTQDVDSVPAAPETDGTADEAATPATETPAGQPATPAPGTAADAPATKDESFFERLKRSVGLGQEKAPPAASGDAE